MSVYAADTVIPAYPFEPDSAMGNKFFRIRENDAVTFYKKSDFLVPHRKDYYFFVLVRAGNSRHWVDTTPYILQPNTFYFTTPWQVHLKEESKPLSGVTFSFTEEFLAMDDSGFLKTLPIIRNEHNGHELRLDEPALAFIEDMIARIDAEYRATGPWQFNMLQSYVKVLLIYVSRLYTTQFSENPASPDRVLLKRYLDKIEESYTRLHEVAAYASLLHISPGHLSEVVKEQSGKPAITHIHERLVVEARRLLFHTDAVIKEIAFELGFADASYFNRFFKRMTGQTPVEYRTQIREMYH